MQVSSGLGCGGEALNARDHPSRACGRMHKPAGPALTQHPSLVIAECVCVSETKRETERGGAGWEGFSWKGLFVMVWSPLQHPRQKG